MRRFLRGLTLAWLFGGTSFVGWAADAGTAELTTLRPFLSKHCYECHGKDKQKGDLRLDTLGADLSKDETMHVWQDVLDAMNLGEMPPKKQPQPSATEAGQAIAVITNSLKLAYERRTTQAGAVTVRRLNRFELRNTIRDLLQLQGSAFNVDNTPRLTDDNGDGRVINNSDNPFREFPEDETHDGFDNLGSHLVMSDFFLKLMFAAADESLKMATVTTARPAVATRRFASPIMGNPKAWDQAKSASLEKYQRTMGHDYDGIYRNSRGGRLRPDGLEKGVGVTARYRITVEASAHHQRHPWGDIIKTNQEEPLRLGRHLAGPKWGGALTQWELPNDGQKRTYTFETEIDKDAAPWLWWENAPDDKVWSDPLIKKYLPAAYTPSPDYKTDKPGRAAWLAAQAKLLLQDYKGPHIRVYSMVVEPLIEQWPPRSHTSLYGAGNIGEADVEKLLLAFAGRAFRRPVSPADIAPYVAYVRSQLQEASAPAPEAKDNKQKAPPKGDTPIMQALRSAYAAMLCSPQFLYLNEKPDLAPSYKIASRLSYFLWSSMPDDTLMELARSGSLTDPRVRAQQVERMLQDPKARAFRLHFPTVWLRLDKLGKMPPSGKDFSFYKNFKLEPMYLAQVESYFTDLLKTNGKIDLLIDSDYTYMNGDLARTIYKREDVTSESLSKVPTKDPRRGGIFTQPAVLTATANGVDTSPVIRGVWVLENVLGTPPAPPPPGVPALSPDLRNAKTIREQLDAHRKDETCAACHAKIDPLGFAFENFDPVGRWRDTYPETKTRIDPTATLTTGENVKDIVEFKKLLVSRKKQVIRCLTEKMLVYSSGRMLAPADRGETDHIVSQLETKGNGLRDLVKLVVESKVFLQP